MATMITNDCINCGACEPECPNNAISQGDPVYVIDPKLCTECVGFHDYEACAAVCPVDVCVTDPNNIESEEVLMARARAIHPEVSFPENFESRFRKGEGKASSGDGCRRCCAKRCRRQCSSERLCRGRRQLYSTPGNRLMEHSPALFQMQRRADRERKEFRHRQRHLLSELQ
jgi:hypothetical protein